MCRVKIYKTIPSPKQEKKKRQKKKKNRKKRDNTDLNDMPMHVCRIKRFTHYTTENSARTAFYLLEIIPCSVLTDNDECIRIYYGKERTLVLLQCYPFSRI